MIDDDFFFAYNSWLIEALTNAMYNFEKNLMIHCTAKIIVTSEITNFKKRSSSERVDFQKTPDALDKCNYFELVIKHKFDVLEDKQSNDLVPVEVYKSELEKSIDNFEVLLALQDYQDYRIRLKHYSSYLDSNVRDHTIVNFYIQPDIEIAAIEDILMLISVEDLELLGLLADGWFQSLAYK